MRTPPWILVADDSAENREILSARLAANGYHVLMAADGEEALAVARAEQPDLILLDVMMPKVNGLDVCRRLKADASLPFMPVILVTARGDTQDIVAALEGGPDESLTKPVDQTALLARVKAALRIKSLQDTVQAQATQLAEWNRTLEGRVAEQLAELERVGRLKRFLSPQLAEVIISSGDEAFLESHRREITVVFTDLRGFTAFSETAEPEEVISILREYHAALGRIVLAHEGTVEHFAGDGVMILFNDPLPLDEPELAAIRMAPEMRTGGAALAT